MVTRTTVTVDSGALSGESLDGGAVRRFLGVPYGAAPVGELRWRPPQPVAPWEGERDAVEYGPSSTQLPPAEQSLYYGGEKVFSEDCLNLNVWTGAEGDSGRPVMVWFHFGAYQFGSASNPLYDGEGLAEAGVTLVSVNARLGRMGFFAHPELSAESGYGGSGNYGLMDQILALEWVQRNIAAFGGDPGNVTIFGVSAGGHSVHNLRSSPLAKGLFHRAIAHSGPGVSKALDGYGHPSNTHTMRAGEEAGAEVSALLGGKTLAEMRAMPADEILAPQLPRGAGGLSFDFLPGAQISLHVFDSSYPVVDGHVLPTDVATAYDTGDIIDVPFIAGNVGNESSGLPYASTLEKYRAYLAESFGGLADELFALYPAGDDAEAQEASWQLNADHIFVSSSWLAVNLHRRNMQSPVWHFRFLREPSIPADSGIIEGAYARSFHGADILYVFDTLASRDWDWTDADRALSERMMRSWVSFAKSGDPTAGGAVEWPEFEPGTPSSRIWDLEDRVDDVSDPARMAFWARWNGVAL